MHRKNRRAKLQEQTTNYMGKDATVYDQLDAALRQNSSDMTIDFECEVTAMTTETEVVDALSDGEKGTIIVEQTPFYATMGGQEADKGVICTADGEFVVEDVFNLQEQRLDMQACCKRNDQDW